MRFRVVKTDSDLRDTAVEQAALAAIDAELIEAHCTTEAEVMAAAAGADALLVIAAPITARVIGTLDRCRVISRYGVGVDMVDMAAATAAGICVTNIPDYCVDEVSDHALAMLLALTRKLLPLHRAVSAGTWDTIGVARPVYRLRGRVLGLLGFGRIARRLAEKATALGLQVWAYDPYVTAADLQTAGVRPVALPELLAGSDILSLHSPLTPETRHLIDAAALAAMKPGAWVINVSRGGLIDEAALLEALQSGHLAGAGLDVWEREPPPPGHPLLALSNVIGSSHSGFYSEESLREVQQRAVGAVTCVLQGQAPDNLVNPQVLSQLRVPLQPAT